MIDKVRFRAGIDDGMGNDGEVPENYLFDTEIEALQWLFHTTAYMDRGYVRVWVTRRERIGKSTVESSLVLNAARNERGVWGLVTWI